MTDVSKQLAQAIRAHLDNTEQVARATMLETGPDTGTWRSAKHEIHDRLGHSIVRWTWPSIAEHIVRHDPTATLEQVDAHREMLDEDLVDEHNIGWETYCDPTQGVCDCGRDERVERRLKLLARAVGVTLTS